MDPFFPRITKVYGDFNIIKRPSKLSSEEKDKLLKKLFNKEPDLFSEDPEIQRKIKDRLGWVEGYKYIESRIESLKKLADNLREEFKQVIWCGMGGSALFPLVLSEIFGARDGYPQLRVLDTNDPKHILEVETLPLEETLFVVASKSGTTLETLSQLRYFWARLKERVSKPEKHLIVLTDPNSPLEALAVENNFRAVIQHPPDVGGRYAALTEVGFFAALLLGLDIQRALHYAKEIYSACEPEIHWEYNLAANLAEFLTESYILGQDKLTFIVDPLLRPFALWLEQLLAESLGKNFSGIVPIVGESPGSPTVYSTDRSFIYLTLRGREKIYQRLITDLLEEGFRVKRMVLEDRYEIFAEAYRFMLATALTAYFIGVNPFDEPDVLLSKRKTREILEKFKKEEDFGIEFNIDDETGLGFYFEKTLGLEYPRLSAALKKLFQDFAPWIYVGFLAYLPQEPEVEELIRDMRTLIREKKNCATVFGFGPRYLHSTGQLFKGGPPLSRFIIFTRRGRLERQLIPGENYTFWDQQFAQAYGDFQALVEREKPVLWIHLFNDYKEDLKIFQELLEKVLSS
ncbi:MAG: phosphoheptose isomerase [Caldimicrobium sp.]|nr:phosphoheptose isomerase [Caldimicrobium sp.]MCX7613642.1 phosphoheptose isomerase [Caldimicrobium sp.]MDW8182681.1 phosphoheptose isomerase [Caldimicrobium sp.]